VVCRTADGRASYIGFADYRHKGIASGQFVVAERLEVSAAQARQRQAQQK
jgi:hypothetical protein